MDNLIETLNYDFKHYMFLAKSNLRNIKDDEARERSVRWLHALSRCKRNVEEMRQRNQLLNYLFSNIQENELKPPFTEEPPEGPLPPLATLLSGSSRQDGHATDLNYGEKIHGCEPLIYQFSPDGGAFLTAQPVPKCGAFCYLAVVSQGKL